MNSQRAVLGRVMLFSFALPSVMQGFMHGPEGIIQGIYAKHAGLPLTQIAAAILLTRIFDGITYPAIGYLSDLIAGRTGSHKPFIAAGTVVTVIGLWFLFRPPPGVTVVYFGAWSMVTYIGWKLTEVPYTAWSIALSTDYAQRARIQTWRGLALAVGGLLFYAVPYGSRVLGLGATTEFNLQTLSLAAVVMAVGAPLMNAWSLLAVPDGDTATTRSRAARHSLRHTWAAVVRNGPLLRFLLAFGPVHFLSGMSAGVIYLYIDGYLGMGEYLAPAVMSAALAAFVGIPLWGQACARFERHRVCAVSMALGGIGYLVLGALPQGKESLVPALVLYPLCVLSLSAIVVAAPAMLGDTADHGRLEYGENHAGTYSALYAFLIRSLGGLSAAAGIAVAGWFGFDATSHTQTTLGAVGIRLVTFTGPALGMLFALPVLWRFPIDRERQAAIRAALLARATARELAELDAPHGRSE